MKMNRCCQEELRRPTAWLLQMRVSGNSWTGEAGGQRQTRVGNEFLVIYYLFCPELVPGRHRDESHIDDVRHEERSLTKQKAQGLWRPFCPSITNTLVGGAVGGVRPSTINLGLDNKTGEASLLLLKRIMITSTGAEILLTHWSNINHLIIIIIRIRYHRQMRC